MREKKLVAVGSWIVQETAWTPDPVKPAAGAVIETTGAVPVTATEPSKFAEEYRTAIASVPGVCGIHSENPEGPCTVVSTSPSASDESTVVTEGVKKRV